MLDLTERLKDLSPEQKKLLELKLKRQSIDLLQIPITQEYRKGYDPFPLSFGQERLWFLQQLDPHNSAYNLLRVTRLSGELDRQALARAINEIVRRHQVLRTIFGFEGARPIQAILPDLSLPLAGIDLSGLPPEQQESEVERIIQGESVRPFDLSAAPLLRSKLLKLSDVEHVFLLVIHHIVADGTSIQVFIRELVRLYDAFCQGRPSPLAELTVQYVDYACWQRRWLGDEDMMSPFKKRQESFWLDQFGGDIPVLTLPTDYNRPPLQSFEGRTLPFQLDGDETGFLKELVSREKTTLYVVCLSIYNLFLSRLAGTEDVVVGTPVAGRRHPDARGLIGMFVNTLALRNYPHAGKRFIDFLREVKERTLGAFENQEYRYEDILERVTVKRDTSRNPLFDVMFLFKNVDYAEVDLPGLRLSYADYESQTSKFDLTLSSWEEGDGLHFSFEYCTKLFKQGAIERFIGYFRQLVRGLRRDIDTRLWAIELLPEQEKRQILYDFNDTEIDYPADKTIHQWFDEQAEKRPDHISLMCENQRLSYRALAERSDRLAHCLAERESRPNSIVAIMVERSPEMPVGILAILKAGAAYLPIDPGYPGDRVRFMLADSGASMVLIDHPDRLPSSIKGDLSLTAIGTQDTGCERSSGIENRASAPSGLAYVIYTSGSTGRPKGVAVKHSSCVNLLWGLQRAYPVNPGDAYLLKTAFVFDVSVTELFGCWTGGGRLVVLPKGGEKDPQQIVSTIETAAVTHINFVPSMFNMFMEVLTTGGIHRLSPLKYIFLAGEALSAGVVDKFRRLAAKIVLENIYGPTEAAVYTTWYSLSRWSGQAPVPIGRPLPNVKCFIVDGETQLQPIGVPGELCVAGEGLARGYLNNPELTADRFMNLAAKTREGTRSSKNEILTPKSQILYRTGDLCRFLPDGSIEFLGRLDHQVKIRGYRIELAEIESRLVKHDGVEEAVVVDRQEPDGNRRLVAFIVGTAKGALTAAPAAAELREYLAHSLPDYMIPDYFVPLTQIPLTLNKKIDRRALREYEGLVPQVRAEYLETQTGLEKRIADCWMKVLGLERVGVHDNFFELGGNSFNIIQLNRLLKETLDRDIPVVSMYTHLTIDSFARYLMAGEGQADERRPHAGGERFRSKVTLPGDGEYGLDVAIVGMGARFPGAGNIHEFWDNLENGVLSITFFSDRELAGAGVDPRVLQSPDYVRARGILEDIEYFDAFFFGYPPLEAELLDPQVRLFYEICWQALEDAGCDPSTYNGAIGVYGGANSNRWWQVLALLSGKGDILGQYTSKYLFDKDFMTTRTAYKLDLKGPAVSVQTACSTALVAVAVACQALLIGQCDAALAGAVSVLPETMRAGYVYDEGLIYSPDGHCRAFDAGAKGTVFSDGAGVVFLKRLAPALSHGDSIYAVIKGFGLNNDGIVKSSYTAPNVDGQCAAVEAALDMAGVAPEAITYVETHGTGTALGDPIEIEALRRAFHTAKRQYCAVGSVKTNIGHLDTAAGIAGFIKTILALKHRLIPPSLHFETANPAIDFENTPFYVNAELQEWRGNGQPLRAGVSSFGVGGTNAHVILEEAPPPGETSEGRAWQLILLSARTGTALEQADKNFVDYVKANPDINLADAAYTLMVGRKAFEHRRMLVCRDLAGIIHTPGAEGQAVAREEKRAVFMFPGQGSQYVSMARGLYEHEPRFRQEMDRCFEILDELMGDDIGGILYPSGHPSQEGITGTGVAQPLIFAVEYALARLLMAWGINPYAMIGHSIGEYTAACLAGVFSLEDALHLVYWRGKLMQQMPPGSMLSVPLSQGDVEPLLTAGLALAAVNGPSRCVVSGPHQAVDAFERRLTAGGHHCRRLHTSHAFHSQMMAPVLKKFQEKVSQVSRHEPRIPFISNVTGTWITFKEAASAAYWAEHLRRTVYFGSGLVVLFKEKNALFIELGPGQTLSTLARQHPARMPDQFTVNLIRHPDRSVADEFYLLSQIGQLWLHGQGVDWHEFYAGQKRRILHLPTYPFERRRYWLEGDPYKIRQDRARAETRPAKRPDIADWFYVPSWKRSVISEVTGGEAEGHHRWLFLTKDDPFASRFVGRLRQDGHEVTLVRPGPGFVEEEDGSYTVAAGQERDYEALLESLRASGGLPDRIVHLWSLTDEDEDKFSQGNGNLEECLDLGFYSLIYLCRALSSIEPGAEVQVTAVTNQLQQVAGEKVLAPERAVLLGPVLVIPVEFPRFSCRCIDIGIPQSAKEEEKWLIGRLIEEMRGTITDLLVAYRGRCRLTRTFEPASLRQSTPTASTVPRLIRGGVYLITGGLGGIGLTLARHLAEAVQCKLVLTGRSAFPQPETWPQCLDTHGSGDRLAAKIRQLKELEALGAEVVVFSVDVTDLEGMGRVVERTRKRFGEINGVIHAAGLPGSGVIQLKTRRAADSVMLPKVGGALVLERVLRDTKLEFFVLCSSINAVLPILGQVDYCAANAFLDAFAHYRSSVDGGCTVSVNWDAWQRVGMAAEAALGQKKASHPLLDHYTVRNNGRGTEQRIYTSYLSIDRHWVLGGHMTREGKGFAPGVAYLEMVRAALEERRENRGVVIREALFQSPLLVEKGQEREVRTVLKGKDRDFDFLIQGRIGPAGNGWQIHARGEVRLEPMPPQPTRHNLEEIKNSCNVAEIDGESRWSERQEGSLIVFGPRWANIKRVYLGENRGLALVELPGSFAGEIEEYWLHPAMLDTAVGFLYGHIHTETPYIPYYYKKLTVSGRLPARIYSFSQLHGDKESDGEFLKFDVIIMDEEGRELLNIEEFTMLEVSEELLGRLKESAHPGGAAALETAEEEPLKEGIMPAEGVEAFTRILERAEELCQVVVSTRDLLSRFEAVKMAAAALLAGDSGELQSHVPGHARPDIGSEYAAPATAAEQKLAAIWQELLGIEKIGIDDDFFELGGDSLKATVMISRINEEFKGKISMREIFNTPRVRNLAGFLEGPVDSKHNPIAPAEEKEYYAVSPMQRRFYIVNEMEGTHTAFNLPWIMRVEGDLDEGRFERAFRLLIQRHDSLRSAFVMVKDEPVQVIGRQVNFHVSYMEAPGTNTDIHDIMADFVRPFDLSRAPLLRAGLVKLADGNHLLLFDIHHIIADGSAVRVLVNDFVALYEGRALPELRIQYRDFSEWQTGSRGRKILARQAAYWLERFKGEIPRLNIYTDYPRPAVQSFEGARVEFFFDSEMVQGLNRLMRETGTTLYMVILAAYNILLAKHAGQEDIIVGSPVAAREYADLQNLIGLFLNTLPMRNHPAGDRTFAGFLQEVKENTIKAFDNQGYPYEELIKRLDLIQDVSRSPLFDAELLVQNVELKRLEIGGVKFIPFTYEPQVAQHDISLQAIEVEGGIHFNLEYCKKLFKRETIERFRDFFKKIVTSVMENREIRIKDIKIFQQTKAAATPLVQAEDIQFGF